MKYCDAKASKEASNACSFDCRDAKVSDCFAQSNKVFNTRIDTQQSMLSLIVCNNVQLYCFTVCCLGLH